MAKIKESFITCGYCRTKFGSPIFFASTESFESAIMSGNRAQCANPACGKMINCNSENMSYTLEGGSGGFMGSDFSDNKD
jgi:hypothetical protein